MLHLYEQGNNGGNFRYPPITFGNRVKKTPLLLPHAWCQNVVKLNMLSLTR